MLKLCRTSEAKFGGKNLRVGLQSGRNGAKASEGRQAGCRGPRRLMNGAGNGIRTRDFDLGKVALYH